MPWHLRLPKLGAESSSHGSQRHRKRPQVYDGSGLASSPLALPGAKARTVELFSFAKSYQIVSRRFRVGSRFDWVVGRFRVG